MYIIFTHFGRRYWGHHHDASVCVCASIVATAIDLVVWLFVCLCSTLLSIMLPSLLGVTAFKNMRCAPLDTSNTMKTFEDKQTRTSSMNYRNAQRHKCRTFVHSYSSAALFVYAYIDEQSGAQNNIHNTTPIISCESVCWLNCIFIYFFR